MRFQMDESFYKLFCCSSLEDDVKELIAWTCWYIWTERCSVQIGKNKLNIIGVVEKIKYAFGEKRKLLNKDTDVGVGKSGTWIIMWNGSHLRKIISK